MLYKEQDMKNLKNTLLIASLIITSAFTLTACKSESAAPADIQKLQQPEDHANDNETEGGISAGGGGTLPANPIAVFQAKEIVGKAKQFLRLYFNYERRYFSKSTSALDYKKFYYGENNLATQLEKTDIEILEDKPCLNKFGKEVDASIYASRANTICISAQRIAPKLIKENASKEINALLVHELSHFLGANEKEATDIQKWVVIRIREVSSKEADQLESKLQDLTTGLGYDFSQVETLLKAIDQNRIIDIKKSLEKIFQNLRTYDEQLKGLPFAFVDYEILITKKLSGLSLILQKRI